MAKKKPAAVSVLADGLPNMYFETDPAPRLGVVAAVAPDPIPDEDVAPEAGASSPVPGADDHPDIEEPDADTVSGMTEQEEQP